MISNALVFEVEYMRREDGGVRASSPDLMGLHLSREDYKAVLEKAGKRGTLEFHKAAFDLDILGLRAGGAAKYDDYYSDDESPSSDED